MPISGMLITCLLCKSEKSYKTLVYRTMKKHAYADGWRLHTKQNTGEQKWVCPKCEEMIFIGIQTHRKPPAEIEDFDF